MSSVFVKSYRSDSFLSPNSRASTKLSTRLSDRYALRGEPKCLFITLTYNREDYKSPLHLYREQREQRHFRRFVARVSNYLGEDTNGKWIRKIEFQEGGWIHFHLILDTDKTIPHSDLCMLWGHGHTWINRGNKSRINYFCKYIAKEHGEVPAYILAEPQRSVKIVAVSPSYWDDLPSRSHSSVPRTSWAVYSPVVNSFGPKCILKTEGSQRTIQGSIWDVMNMLVDNGGLVVGSYNEYLHVTLHNSGLIDAIHPQTLRRDRPLGDPPPLLDNGVKCANALEDSLPLSSSDRRVSTPVFSSNPDFFIKYFFGEE